MAISNRLVETYMDRKETSRLSVQLFGVLKSASPGGVMEVELPAGASAADLRSALEERLASVLSEQGRAALEASAIGTDDRLLLDDESIDSLRVVAVLPPVSGG